MDPLSWLEIFGRLFVQLLPVWAAMIVTLFAVSIALKRRLGLYGRLFDSVVGMIGFALVMFWVFTALFADMIITHDPLGQFSGLKQCRTGQPPARCGRRLCLLSCWAAMRWRAMSSRAWSLARARCCASRLLLR
jgi:hypothetical protein